MTNHLPYLTNAQPTPVDVELDIEQVMLSYNVKKLVFSIKDWCVYIATRVLQRDTLLL